MKIKNINLFDHEASVLWDATKDVKKGNLEKKEQNKKKAITNKTIDYGISWRESILKFGKLVNRLIYRLWSIR